MSENTKHKLTWDVDGREYSLDDSIIMGKGYDWDGYEYCREEAAGKGFGYIIWPDSISSDSYSLYGTYDGLYCQNLSRADAVERAQMDCDDILSNQGITS